MKYALVSISEDFGHWVRLFKSELLAYRYATKLIREKFDEADADFINSKKTEKQFVKHWAEALDMCEWLVVLKIKEVESFPGTLSR